MSTGFRVGTIFDASSLARPIQHGYPARVPTARDPGALETLRAVFHHDGYRPGQEEIIDAVLSGSPTLAVMPTGSGKSLCYQLPAIVLGGLTVVVSPLIALIQEQVRMLRRLDVRAAAITSADSEEDRRRALESIKRRELVLAYVAPERFKSKSFMALLVETGVDLLVIDEAHCISQWGHDFRPDYARLGGVLAELKPTRIACLTATATERVRGDIVASLGIEAARTIVTGFDRPNLELAVIETQRRDGKIEATVAALAKWMGAKGSAIVYAATRKRVEQVAVELRSHGFLADAYHAGLPSHERTRVQETFEREGRRVVVATTAFGMGVDKRDVRVVVHYEIPRAPESYYQEVGRAGRDGEPAAGILLFDNGDLRYAYMKLEASCPTERAVLSAFDRLATLADEDGRIERSFDELVEAIEKDVGIAARASLIALERSGDVGFEPGAVQLERSSPRIDKTALELRGRQERASLDAMIGYVMRASCRRRYLVDYFGDHRRPDRCGTCDRCRMPPESELEGEALDDARKALSCIARMRGRFGKVRVAEVLLGSRAKPVLDARLDQLSTHGLLAGWGRPDVLKLLDALTRSELARVTPGEFPKLMLTEKGAEALRTMSPIALDVELRRWRKDHQGSIDPQEQDEPSSPIDAGLGERLKSWRTKRARELGVPPYIIAHNTLLDSIARSKPRDLGALAATPGIGPAKLAKFGAEIIDLVRAHEGSEHA
jgi:ATP-dependent DNA helicase RecQ